MTEATTVTVDDYQVDPDTADNLPKKDLRGAVRYWITSRNWWSRAYHELHAENERLRAELEQASTHTLGLAQQLVELIRGSATTAAVTLATLASADTLRSMGEDESAEQVMDTLRTSLYTLHESLGNALDSVPYPAEQELIARIQGR